MTLVVIILAGNLIIVLWDRRRMRRELAAVKKELELKTSEHFEFKKGLADATGILVNGELTFVRVTKEEEWPEVIG